MGGECKGNGWGRFSVAILATILVLAVTTGTEADYHEDNCDDGGDQYGESDCSGVACRGPLCEGSDGGPSILDTSDGSDGDDDDGGGSDVEVTVAMVGEIGWCDANAATWDIEMEDRFNNVLEPGFSDTDADLDLEWMACTFSADTWTYDHSLDSVGHCHDADCSDWHPYAFNKVPANPNHKIGNRNETTADDGYMQAVPHLDGTDYPDALGGHVGVEAYAWHFRQHADVAETDLVQLVHDAEFHKEGDENLEDLTVFGSGAQAGEISAFFWDQDQYSSTHEAGHNLDATHCDATVEADGDGTVMVKTDACDYWSDPHDLVNYFSSDNVDHVDAHVSSTYG